MNIIYVLTDPRDGAVRYVGVTHYTAPERLAGHINKARSGKGSYAGRWIRALLALELRPQIAVIEETQDRMREKCWIQYYRAKGARLTNTTDGGEGTLGYHQPKSEAHRKAMAAARTGKHHSDSTKAAISRAKMGTPCTDEHRRKISAANAGRKAHINTRLALIESNHRRVGEKAGEKHPRHKLTQAQVDEIRQKYADRKTPTRVIAAIYGVSQPLISYILIGKSWRPTTAESTTVLSEMGTHTRRPSLEQTGTERADLVALARELAAQGRTVHLSPASRAVQWLLVECPEVQSRHKMRAFSRRAQWEELVARGFRVVPKRRVEIPSISP